VVPLGSRDIVQVAAHREQGRSTATAESQHAGLPEGGWSYRARSTAGTGAGVDVGASYLGSTGQYSASARQAAGGEQSQFLHVRGGIAQLGGHVLASRWIDDSFAVVEAPVQQPVDVYANHRRVAQTANGVALVPRLVAYEPNVVRLDDAGVPMDVSLDLHEKTIVPTSRSGVLLRYAGSKLKGATLLLVDAAGVPLPVGATVRVVGQDDVQHTALRGEVFLPSVEFPATVLVEHPRGRCMAVADAPAVDVLPRVGPLPCRPLQ